MKVLILYNLPISNKKGILVLFLKRKLFDNRFDYAKVEAAVQIPEEMYNHPMMCIIISWMSKNRSGQEGSE